MPAPFPHRLRDTGDARDLESAEAWLVEQGFQPPDDDRLGDERAPAKLDRGEACLQRRIG